jgi:putative acetyltransferase
MPEIRPAQPTDLDAIAAVHEAAFPTGDEARLVRLLVQRGQDVISLIVTSESHIVGHILFSPATIAVEDRVILTGLGLAPLAVLPAFQNQGFGSALIRQGLDRCRQLAAPFAVVLGEPAYYCRFGFIPASRHNLACEFGGDDAFQIQWLSQIPTLPADTHVRYAPAFRELFGAA